METQYTLQFKFTTSKGQDTYGYNICSLYVNGIKSASCLGGGYDMQGTSFGDWVAKEFQKELRSEFPANLKPSGMRLQDGGSITLDGGYGFAAMQTIFEQIGGTLEYIHLGKTGKNSGMYKATFGTIKSKKAVNNV